MPTTKKRFFKRSTKKEIPDEKKIEKVVSVQKSIPKANEVKKIVRPHYQAQQSPKNPRVITEVVVSKPVSPGMTQAQKAKKKFQFTYKWILVGVCIGFGSIVCSMATIQLYKTYGVWSSLMAKRAVLSQQMQLWENITKQYPDYRDAYVEGAIFAYELGDKDKENYFIGQLQLLDPNLPQIKTLQDLESLQQLQ